MPAKTSQLQIRITPRQKAQLRRRAASAGMDVSTYVLNAVLPPEAMRFAELLRALRAGESSRFVLAALNDFLTGCAPAVFAEAMAFAELGALSPYLANYVAAMVEQAAHLKRVPAPVWTATIAPLGEPRFATSLASLRPHLLSASPVPFKRRNIFVDASIADRV